ncbi:hypothetical protein [Amycolatopsis mediterranei]|uniref:hypothetical protein n=1 Tax=Amycolatopsis mediterranei TaxID=33910 RepID=UPI0002E4FC2D|nr:hypothetical protein [Amycolatopsis mediterranei]UZF74199.1 hypothetical protein ISP_007693 [Amycolatopsis mediterranei]
MAHTVRLRDASTWAGALGLIAWAGGGHAWTVSRVVGPRPSEDGGEHGFEQA